MFIELHIHPQQIYVFICLFWIRSLEPCQGQVRKALSHYYGQ